MWLPWRLRKKPEAETKPGEVDPFYSEVKELTEKNRWREDEEAQKRKDAYERTIRDYHIRLIARITEAASAGRNYCFMDLGSAEGRNGSKHGAFKEAMKRIRAAGFEICDVPDSHRPWSEIYISWKK